MTDTVAQIVFGAVCPLVLAVALAFPGAKAKRDEKGRDRFAWRLVAALGVPVIVAFIALYGWPKEDWQHVMYVPAAALAIGIVSAVTKRGLVRRLVMAVVLGAGVAACIWPIIEPESITLKLGVAGGVALVSLVLEPIGRSAGPATPLALALAVAASAATVLISGFLKLSVPYGALGVALASVGGVSLIRDRSLTLGDGPMAVVASMIVVTPVTAYLYALHNEPSPWPFVLAAAAPLALLLALPARGWIGVVLRFVLVAAPCAAAILMQLNEGEDAAEDDPYADMYRDMMG